MTMCNCPGPWGRSNHPGVRDQTLRASVQRLEDIPAPLFGRREHRAEHGEVLCSVVTADAAGDLLPYFHHAQLLLRQVVGKRHTRIDEKAEHTRLSCGQPHRQAMAHPSRRPAAPAGFCQRRLRVVERQTSPEDRVVALFDQREQHGLQRHLPLTRGVTRVAGAVQQALHPACPVFLLDLYQCLQFARMLRVAQCVESTGQGVVWSPVVMRDNAGDVGQLAVAPRRDAVEREPEGRGDVQLVGSGRDPEAGFLHVLDWRRRHAVRQGGDDTLGGLGTVLAGPGDDRAHQLRPELVSHQHGQTLLGQQLVAQQIDHDGRDPRAVLHRRSDADQRRRSRARAAGSATTAAVRAVFRDDQRLRLRRVEHSAGDVVGGHRRGQRLPACRAGHRAIDRDVRPRRPAQRPAQMALLPAALLARRRAQTADPDRPRQLVARRRLAAVAAVRPKPRVLLGKTRLLRRKQRNEFVLRQGVEHRGIYRLLDIVRTTPCQSRSGTKLPKTHKSTPSFPWRPAGDLGRYDHVV